jgi:hypothetical protein
MGYNKNSGSFKQWLSAKKATVLKEPEVEPQAKRKVKGKSKTKK